MRNIQKCQILPGFQKQYLEPSFWISFTRSAALGGEWPFWLGLSLSISLFLSATQRLPLYDVTPPLSEEIPISPGFQKQYLEPSFWISFTRTAALGGKGRFGLRLFPLYLSLSLCDTKIASL